jgi:acyl-CoA thioesterase I
MIRTVHVGPVTLRWVVLFLLGVALSGCAETPAEPIATVAPTMRLATPTESPTPSPTVPPTPAPTPSPTTSPTLSGAYVALGDSLAVGVGASQQDSLGYVPQLRATLTTPSGGQPQVTSLVNLAVSGETSGSMIGGQLPQAIATIGDVADVALVTLDIGGNDLLRLLRTEQCIAAPAGGACRQLVAQTLAEFEANYRLILSQLDGALAASSPAGHLAVMTYFNPFSGTDAPYEAAGELALLGTDGRLDCGVAGTDATARGMNDIIACVAEEHGAVAVDVHPAFAGLGLELTHIGSEDIHANDVGYRVIAETFAEALAR